jgi:hypothetical protein
LKPSEDILDISKNLLPNGLVKEIEPGSHTAGSSDVGDLTHIMPVLKFETGGVEGGLHSEYFKVVNEEIAYIVTAKIMALTAYRLLKDKAKKAKEIKEEFEPKFTTEQYRRYMDRFEEVIKVNYQEG